MKITTKDLETDIAFPDGHEWPIPVASQLCNAISALDLADHARVEQIRTPAELMAAIAEQYHQEANRARRKQRLYVDLARAIELGEASPEMARQVADGIQSALRRADRRARASQPMPLDDAARGRGLSLRL